MARAKSKVSPQSDVDAASCFLFAEMLLTSDGLQASSLAVPGVSAAHAGPPEYSVSLAKVLDDAGSDKGSRHGYADVYERWAVARDTPVGVVVEIGLGSPSALTPSNMGPEARPGASAIAFSRYFSGARIIGADIDPRSFPSDAEGSFFMVDQLRPPSFGPLLKELADSGGFDFGVVDGLHVPEADINSLVVLLPWLRPLGLLSIEDIGRDPNLVRSWRHLVEALPHPYSGKLHDCHLSHLVTISRA